MPLLSYGHDKNAHNSVHIVLFRSSVQDDAVTATGSTQATAYAIRAGLTRFSTVAAGTGAALPPTRLVGESQMGIEAVIVNDGANALTLYPNVADASGTVNGGSSLSLIPGSIAVARSTSAGVWKVAGGAISGSGAFPTQGVSTLAATGTSQTDAAPILTPIVNVTTAAASRGVLLPPAVAGMSIVVNSLSAVGNTPVIAYPTGTETINGTAGPAGDSLTIPFTAPVTYISFVSGAWVKN